MLKGSKFTFTDLSNLSNSIGFQFVNDSSSILSLVLYRLRFQVRQRHYRTTGKCILKIQRVE